MAKDITIKNAQGTVTYYPKTVSQLVYDNENGKTVKEEFNDVDEIILYQESSSSQTASYDKTSLTIDGYGIIAASGTVKANSAWTCTDYLYFDYSTKAVFSLGRGTTFGYALYDENQVYITGDNSYETYTPYTISLPSNARYVRFCSSNAERDQYFTTILETKTTVNTIRDVVEDLEDSVSNVETSINNISGEIYDGETFDKALELSSAQTGYYTTGGTFGSTLYLHKTAYINVSTDKIKVEGQTNGFNSNSTSVISLLSGDTFVRSVLASIKNQAQTFSQEITMDGTFDTVAVSVRTEANANTIKVSYPKQETYFDTIDERLDVLENPFASKELNILIVGNSFSAKGVGANTNSSAAESSFLTVCYNAGVKCYTEVVGNSGARFEGNYNNYLSGGTCGIHYYGNETSGWTSGGSITIKEAFEKKPWDFIIFHQGSVESGNLSSYEPYLTNFIKAAKLDCPNEYVKIGLQLTWAYANSEGTYPNQSTGFSSQTAMYDAIVNCYETESEEHKITYVVPSGTAIQNARGTRLGTDHSDFAASDADAVHINNYGSVLTSLAFFSILIGRDYGISIKDIPQFTNLYDAADYAIAIDCVTNAVKLPYEVNVPTVSE